MYFKGERNLAIDITNNKKYLTQAESILNHLKEGKSITPLEALYDFGCFRLASRISDLKKAGHDIESKWKPVRAKKTNRVVKIKEYRLRQLAMTLGT